MEKSFTYIAFGINLRSEKLELPELISSSNRKLNDLNIIQNNSSNWPKIKKSEYDTTFLKIQKNDLRLEIKGIGKFRITNGKLIEWERESENVSDSDLRTFLLGSAFGAILIQRGITTFHANALEKNGKGIICLGRSGVGKSTIAYALIQDGWNLIADDLVALNEDGYILPGIPRIKLWHDSAFSFGLDPKKLTKVRKGIYKYSLTGQQIPKTFSPVPLKCMYRISSQRIYQSENINNLNKIKNEKDSMIILRNNLFRPRFIRGLGQESRCFGFISNLSKNYLLMNLSAPNGIENMQNWVKKVDLNNSRYD